MDRAFFVGTLAVALGMLPVAGAQEARQPAVTAAVQVTANPDPVRAHTSPAIALNPKNGELVVVEADVRGSRKCSVHISTDDGRSWFPGGDPMVEPYTDCTIGAEWGSYFSALFDRNGVLYIPFAANDRKAFESSDRAPGVGNERSTVPRHIFLARSTDGGRSFETARVYAAPDDDPARGYAYGIMGAIDPSDPSRVYVEWAQGDFLDKEHKTHAVVAASSDGGKTFGAPVDITDERGSEEAWVTVDGDGVLHAAYWSLGFDEGLTVFERGPEDAPLPLVYARSTDGGKTWRRRDIDPGYQIYPRHPVIAADPNSQSLYVAWFGGAKSENLPDFFEDKDRADVYLRASRDGGRSWSDRIVVNDDPGNAVNQEHPNLAVSPDGRLDVAWYDFRFSPRKAANPLEDTGLQDVFYASSRDQARTFGRSVKVNDRMIDRSIGVYSNNVNSVAPIGLFSTDDSVYLAWQDSRNGNEDTDAEDVYMSKVALQGATAADAGEPSRLLWALIGAAVTTALAGAILLLLTTRMRRRAGPAP